jgi:hypothetical protein
MSLKATGVGDATSLSTTFSTRLWGTPLLAARLVWIVLIVLVLSFYTLEIAADFLAGRYSFLVWRAGMPLGFALIGAVVAWRRSNDWMALLVSFHLITLGTYLLTGVVETWAVRPGWHVLNAFPAMAASGAFVLFFFLFPNGRLVPHWTRPLALIAPVFFFVIYIVAPWVPEILPFGILAAFAFTIVGLYAQVYRYRYASTLLERQQVKWILFGLTGSPLVFLLYALLTITGTLSTFWQHPLFLLYIFPMVAMALLFPASVALAILRYRLFDIDVIINRTLIYGSLTAVLTLVYFISVVLLQSVLRGLTGQANDLALIISTLAIAVLFSPLRRRIQELIDRQFYRRRYNAQQILTTFGTTLRHQIELDQLCDTLLGVVEQTMQPAHISLWLRDNYRRPEEGLLEEKPLETST